MEYLNGLNDKQKMAVLHKDGPALVVAGAGSGKTKVLTTRIVNLINNGVLSKNILAITFTNKASKEMKERIYNLIGNIDSYIGTFHSLGLRIIKENYSVLGLSRNFTIVDSDDQTSILKKIIKDLFNDNGIVDVKYAKNKISFIKNEMLSNGEINKYFVSDMDKDVIRIYNEYEKLLNKNSCVDFDDLLRLPVKLFMENKDILNIYQERYKYILIDEYQDTNEVQYKFIKLLASKYKNIFVVGDQNQAIYGFRLANYKNIVNFEKDYKDACVYILDQNYRSTTNILSAANSVIKNNTRKKEVNLFSELGEGNKIKYYRASNDREEVDFILDEVEKLKKEGYSLNDMAIFYRTNASSRVFEDELLKRNIAYKIVGSFYFYKRKEIKDLLCYLRLIVNHDDDISLKRIINVPKRKIGAKTISNIEKISIIENTSMFNCLSDTGNEGEFKKLINDLTSEIENKTITEIIDLVLEKSGYLKELENENSLEADLRRENLLEFRSVSENYEENMGTVMLEDFLNEIAILADKVEYTEYDDVLTLMTLHASKGLEFKVVFISCMEEGIMPHANSFYDLEELEEERRLCYVGITRSRERLYLTNAKKRLLFGSFQNNPESRFISEIDSEFIEQIETKKDVSVFDKLGYNNDNGDYKPGDKVIHMTFGPGSVINIDDKFLTVAFSKRFGVKKILKDYKGLKKGK